MSLNLPVSHTSIVFNVPYAMYMYVCILLGDGDTVDTILVFMS